MWLSEQKSDEVALDDAPPWVEMEDIAREPHILGRQPSSNHHGSRQSVRMRAKVPFTCVREAEPLSLYNQARPVTQDHLPHEDQCEN